MTEKTRPMLESIEEELGRLRQIRGLLAGAPVDAHAAFRAPKRRLGPEARQRTTDDQRQRRTAEKMPR